ncbi:MAG: signal peptidase I [Lachnospiraceae bacterium]|nr:signal peptidase I [Lachnospiraceae bacterium]
MEEWNKEEQRQEGIEPENAEKKAKTGGILKELAIYALLIILCVKIIPTYVMQRTIVDGPSMENTLHDGESLLVEKISWHFGWIDRFDIIVFYPYGRNVENEYYVKRVIGLPGETVQIIGEEIYINGELLKEDYGKEPITNPGRAAEPITLGEDEYFVLGDNREVSLDSRYTQVGNVKRENIGGKAILRIWPLNQFGIPD